MTSFLQLSCGAVVLTTASRCTALCRTMLNCILLCCQVQVLMKQWHFDAIKEYFLSEGHCPSLLSVCRQKKYQFCLASLEVAPWFCCHCCTVFITSLLSLTPTLFSSASIFPIVVMWKWCDMDLDWIKKKKKLHLRQHFSLRPRVESHLICQDWQTQTPNVPITLHLSVCIAETKHNILIGGACSGNCTAWSKCYSECSSQTYCTGSISLGRVQASAHTWTHLKADKGDWWKTNIPFSPSRDL